MSTGEESLARLASILEKTEASLAAGDPPDLDAPREELGPLFPEFEELVEARQALEAFMEPPDAVRLPRDLGPYTLQREIGRGGMGVVYEAVRRDTRERVAVKVLRLGFVGRSGARARFRREAEALARLDHPNVVRFIEAGEDGEQPYYVMSLVKGRSLAQLVDAPERPSLETLCAGLADVADALHAMHEAGLVHRDLKPGNLLLGSDGRMLLVDFGLATGDDFLTLTRSGDLLGTPPFMSPEQLLGQHDRIDARTDVYGLGATLYYVLTGRAPFEGESLNALTQALLHERPQRPRALRPGIPRACEQIALTCLEKRPEDRYASAAELRDDLRAFARCRRVTGRPVSWPRRALRAALRRPGRAVGLLLLALAVVYAVIRGPALLRRQAATPRPAPQTREVIGAAQVIEDPVAFTSDGTSIVVAVDRGDGFQLLSISPDGARQTPLTRHPRPARAPQIVGGRLYYRSGPDLVCVPETSVLETAPWAMETAELVVEGVAHAHVSARGDVLIVPTGFEGRRLEAMDAQGADRAVLVDGGEPIASARWSPDATTIAYGERPYGEGDAPALWLLDAATRQRRQLASVPGFTGLTWTKDGRGLVCFRGRGDARALVHVDVAGGQERVLVARAADAALPVLASDGRLAYLVDPWHFNLWLYQDGTLAPVTNYGDTSAVAPHWVAGRDELLHGVFPPDRRALTIVRRSGTALADVTEVRTLPACFESLAITADGTTAYFTERRGDDYVLERVDLTTSAAPVEFLRRARPVFALQVMPSGRVSLAVEADTWESWEVEPDGSRPRRFVAGAGVAMQAYHGRWLSFRRDGTPTRLWIQAADESGRPEGAARPVPGTREILNARWRPDRAELVVVDVDEMAAVDAATLERQRLARWPVLTRVPSQLAVAADGRIVVSLATGRSTVKMIDNFADLLGD